MSSAQVPTTRWVGMVNEAVGRQQLRVEREQSVRAVLAELARQGPAQVERVDDLAVHPAEEVHVGDANGCRGRLLLTLAEGAVFLGADARVLPALLAAGDADVADGPPLVDPAGDCAGGAEVDVIGMREDRQSPLLHVWTLRRVPVLGHPRGSKP